MDNNLQLENGEELFKIAERLNFTQPIEEKELQIEVQKLIDKLNKRANANDAFVLLHYLSLLSIQKVFYSTQEAEKLIRDLNRFKISIPEIVSNCKTEVDKRTNYIERFFKKKEYELTEAEKKAMLSKLEKDYFDQESKLKTIQKNLYELKDQYQEKEKYVLSTYDYDISDFYESIIKDEKSVNLNDYFFHAQLHVQTINLLHFDPVDLFIDLVKTLIYYFKYKKKYYFLKDLYQENLGNSKETLSLKPPKKKPKISLSQFFTDKANPKLIKAIQERFNELDGKELAALIYLLDSKGLISYNNSLKPISRINFVRAFKKDNDLTNIWGINKFFERHKNETILIEPNGNKDKTLINIEKQLTKVVDSC
ncbi:hypothetical protein [Zunongwangia profunda]|uniref:hypothetical protein n=1 Tax=Zunongwangia profunda TaxID=398743 RepID=UPI001D17DFD8|nr:hypothetical protein [Zunongwangia profunda]MCC4230038.1 hypothetical protein [Zunongwangia profunda]